MFICWVLLAAVLPGKSDSLVDFDHDVMPVLTKAGCNVGACHGAAIGRGGFKLSLYGSNPAADYRTIALELKGRRVNLLEPEQSLVIMKPTEAMEHEGGVRIDPGSDSAETVIRWIREGALRSHDDSRPVFKSLEISPASVVADDFDQDVTLKAIAHFSDGSSRDVTRLTVFKPEDPGALSIDSKTADVHIRRRGRHIVIARYLRAVKAIEIIAPFSRQVSAEPVDAPDSFIDTSVNRLLKKIGIPASGQLDDEAFLRRASLDLTGRLPDGQDLRWFLADDERIRRTNLIDRLLASEAFTEYWTLKLAKLLRIHGKPGNERGAEKYHRWLEQQIAENAGYHTIAMSLLTATGDTEQVGPANFYRMVGGPREQAEFTSELFMGSRLRCANCHDHPLDHWTQDDYHGLAAIFAKVRQEPIVRVVDDGQVINPRTGKNAVARIPGERYLDDDHGALQAFARWMVSGDNPYFAKAIVNRLWKSMMGRGLVEPADDLRSTNPATHPDLLQELARDFAEHGYDLRHTLKKIATSDAYGRRSEVSGGNATGGQYYSRHLRKPLEPEVLADAISDVLEIPEIYGQYPAGSRAVKLINPQVESQTLDVLGRCAREESCETSVAAGNTGGLSLKLHLFNGPILNQRIASPKGRLSRLIAAGETNEAIVQSFYRAALSRSVSDDERKFWNEQINGSGDQRRALLEDFVWSLLTCQEFVTNH